MLKLHDVEDILLEFTDISKDITIHALGSKIEEFAIIAPISFRGRILKQLDRFKSSPSYNFVYTHQRSTSRDNFIKIDLKEIHPHFFDYSELEYIFSHCPSKPKILFREKGYSIHLYYKEIPRDWIRDKRRFTISDLNTIKANLKEDKKRYAFTYRIVKDTITGCYKITITKTFKNV